MCYDLKDGQDWLPCPYGPPDLEPTDRPWSIGQLDHRLQRIPRLEIRPTDAASLDAYRQLVFGKLWHRHIFHTAITWSVIASGLQGVLLR
jgi:hypothetical protein